MKISEYKIRKIILEAIRERFTIPKHSKYSGFDLYAEEDESIPEQDSLPEDSVDDDIRSSTGGEKIYSYKEVLDK